MQSFNNYDDRINDNMLATTAYIENTLGDNTNHYNNLDMFMLNLRGSNDYRILMTSIAIIVVTLMINN